MYIALETINVWTFTGEVSARRLFSALPCIAAPEDILVIGSYSQGEVSREWLKSCKQIRAIVRYPYNNEFMDINRLEYPDGGTFEMHCTPARLDGLANVCEVEQDEKGRPAFIDHLVVFRSTKPVLPLLDYHDAFIGGMLTLSGLYTEDDVGIFAKTMGCTAHYSVNPVLKGVSFG